VLRDRALYNQERNCMRSWCSWRMLSGRTVTTNRQIYRVLDCLPNISQPEDNPDSIAFLPYVGTIFNRIGTVLSRHNIKSVGLPLKKLSSFLWPVKHSLGLRIPCAYRISCGCGKVYTGTTGRSVDTRLKEHQWHIRLEQPDKSAVAEHTVDLWHRIQFHKTSILATKTRYMDRIIREVIEIEFPTIWTGWFLSQQVMEASYLRPQGASKASRLPRSMHARNL
jgi:hypothetical protein